MPYLHLPSLNPILHGLKFLNTTPTSICCFIPHVKQCCQKQNFDALSCIYQFPNLIQFNFQFASWFLFCKYFCGNLYVSNSFSFYHEILQSHLACTLINILSHAAHNMELFASTMTACIHMIEIAFLLKAAHISISGARSACLSWCFLFYGKFSTQQNFNNFTASKDGYAQGFRLLLPSVVADNWSWSVGAILIPMGCKALVSIFFFSCSVV